jgi:DNA-binding transcriptional regulator YiaG
MLMLTPEQIREIRKALGLNTTEFGTKLGVTANTVARWELGDRHPRYDTMRRLNELAQEAKLPWAMPALATA